MANNPAQAAEIMTDPLPHFRIRHLEIFWAVIRTGSQHEAARLLGLSQPAVSKLLRHVEDQVGITLFRRAKGRLIPTAEARLFYEAVDEIFGRVEAAERLARDLRRSFTGRVIVATVPGLATNFLPEALGGYLATVPHLHAGVTVLPTAQVIDRVVRHQASVGVLYGPIDATAAQMETICEAAVVCALPPGHRLAAKDVITPADLAGERIISATYMPRWGQLIESAFVQAGVERQLAVNCASSAVAFRMAAAGVGVAVVPMSPLHKNETPPVLLRRFAPALSIPVVVVHSGGEPLDTPAEGLIAWLKAATADYHWDAP